MDEYLRAARQQGESDHHYHGKRTPDSVLVQVIFRVHGSLVSRKRLSGFKRSLTKRERRMILAEYGRAFNNR